MERASTDTFRVTGADTSEIVTPEQLKQIIRVTPRRFQLEDWSKCYSMTRDGASVTRFLQCLESLGGSILIIRDSAGRCFGGFSAEPWASHDSYYGSGECFVFKFDEHKKFAYFPWSGKNEFLTLSNPRGIAMGGGGGYAFQLDAQFKAGSSTPCDTFDSPALAGTPEFTAYYFEGMSLVHRLAGLSPSVCQSLILFCCFCDCDIVWATR